MKKNKVIELDKVRTADTTSKLDILGHDGYSLSMNRTEVAVGGCKKKVQKEKVGEREIRQKG